MDLDKRSNHLANQVKQHPPLVVLVLRRTTGVKALELQVYACGSPRQATYMVECLRAAQMRFVTCICRPRALNELVDPTAAGFFFLMSSQLTEFKCKKHALVKISHNQ
jgi:hypothetical protein